MNNLLQWLTILAAGAVVALYGLYSDRKEFPEECPHPSDKQSRLSFEAEHHEEPMMTGTHR